MECKGGGGAGRLGVSCVACARALVPAHSTSKGASKSSDRLARPARGSVPFISESAFLTLRIHDVVRSVRHFAVVFLDGGPMGEIPTPILLICSNSEQHGVGLNPTHSEIVHALTPATPPVAAATPPVSSRFELARA